MSKLTKRQSRPRIWNTPPNTGLQKADATQDRRHFIGGSDARIIMGSDEKALLALWREKRGEKESADLSGELIVQLGVSD